jgi:hypothetical protein
MLWADQAPTMAQIGRSSHEQAHTAGPPGDVNTRADSLALQSCALFDIGLHAKRSAGIMVYLDMINPVQRCDDCLLSGQTVDGIALGRC